MASISMSDINCDGTIFENNDKQLIYLTPIFHNDIQAIHGYIKRCLPKSDG